VKAGGDVLRFILGNVQ